MLGVHTYRKSCLSCLSRTAILSWDTLELDTSRRLCSHTLVPSTYLLMGDSKNPSHLFQDTRSHMLCPWLLLPCYCYCYHVTTTIPTSTVFLLYCSTTSECGRAPRPKNHNKEGLSFWIRIVDQKHNVNVPWRPAVQGFPRDHQALGGPGDGGGAENVTADGGGHSAC